MKPPGKAVKKYTKKQIIRERWKRGLLNYKLHKGQLLLEELVNKTKHQLIVGELARQSGKTFWIVKKCIETAIRKKNARVKIGTAFHTDLIEFILPAFFIILEDCPQDLKPKYNVQQSKWVFPNASEIKLVGLDRKPNGLRGTVVDLIAIDEAGFTSKLGYLYKSVIIPATTHRPDCKILLFSTPPTTPAHEFNDYVQKAQIEGGYLKLTIYDNPMLDEANIARLMKEVDGPESTTWRREYLCEHVTDDDLAICAEWKAQYVHPVIIDEYHEHYLKYVALDLGVKHYTAAIFGYYDFKTAQLKIYDEWFSKGSKLTTKVIQTNIKRKELIRFAGMDEFEAFKRSDEEIDDAWEFTHQRVKNSYRVSDNNNPLLLNDLSTLHKIHFTPTDKGRLHEMVNTLKLLIREGAVIVDPRCTYLIGCLEWGVWNEKKTEFAESKVFGHFDALASLIYLVRNLNRTTNPIPYDFKVDRQNQIVFPKRNTHSESARSLGQAFRGRHGG